MLRLVLAVFLGALPAIWAEEAHPHVFRMGGFDVCSFTEAEWSKLDEAYVGFIAQVVGKSADDVKDVAGSPGHVSIHSAEPNPQMPMPVHLVSFTLEGGDVDVSKFDEMVHKAGGKKLRDSVHDILVPSPPDLHKSALAKRVVAKADKDGDGKLDVSELIATLRLTYQLPKDTSEVDGNHGPLSVEKDLEEQLKKNDGKAEPILVDKGINLQQMACKLGVAEEPADQGIECGLLDRIFIPKVQGQHKIPLNGPLTGLHFQGKAKDLESNREECKKFDAGDEIAGGVEAASKFEVPELVPAAMPSSNSFPVLAAAVLPASALAVAGLAARLQSRRSMPDDFTGDQQQHMHELLPVNGACVDDA